MCAICSLCVPSLNRTCPWLYAWPQKESSSSNHHFSEGIIVSGGVHIYFCWPLLGARWKLHQRIRGRFLASLLHWTYQLVTLSVFCCKTQPDVIPNVRIHFDFVMKHACLCEMSTGFDREQVVWNLASSRGTLPWPKTCSEDLQKGIRFGSKMFQTFSPPKLTCNMALEK